MAISEKTHTRSIAAIALSSSVLSAGIAYYGGGLPAMGWMAFGYLSSFILVWALLTLGEH